MIENRKIANFSRYEICMDGTIISLNYNHTNKPKALKPGKAGKYYQVILIGDDGKKYHMSVHKLVALAFIPNPANLPCINHKNYNTLDNNVHNLEWCSYSYNINYGDSNTRRSINSCIGLLQYTQDEKFIKEWRDFKSVFKELHISSKLCTKMRQNPLDFTEYGGYKWKYKQKDKKCNSYRV